MAKTSKKECLNTDSIRGVLLDARFQGHRKFETFYIYVYILE